MRLSLKVLFLAALTVWAFIPLTVAAQYNPPQVAATQFNQSNSLPTACSAMQVYGLISGTSGSPYYCSAPNTWTAFGGGVGGTVTSFSAGTLSPIFTTSVATATTTPALSFTLSTQTANTLFAGPASGSAAGPTFRALVSADIPNNAANTTGTSGGLTGSPAITVSSCTGCGGGSSIPIVSPYTFVAETTGTAVTTPAISVTAGQLLIVSCRFGVGSTCVSTDSASDTFTPITAQNIGGVGTGIRMSYAIATATGSTTFTCTQGSSGGGLSCIAFPISGITGTSPNTNNGSTTTSNSTVVGHLQNTVSFTFTTTARTIDIFCGAIDSGADTLQPGILAGGFGTIVALSSASQGTNADQGCEVQIVPYALPGGTAAMLYGSHAVESAYSVIAWPY